MQGLLFCGAPGEDLRDVQIPWSPQANVHEEVGEEQLDPDWRHSVQGASLVGGIPTLAA